MTDTMTTTPRPRLAAFGSMLDALKSAESFMAGFEGDELQEGIGERLASVRAAISGAEVVNAPPSTQWLESLWADLLDLKSVGMKPFPHYAVPKDMLGGWLDDVEAAVVYGDGRPVRVDLAELSTILAALRYWQREGIYSGGAEHDLATCDGECEALGAEKVDELCERLNGSQTDGAAPITPGVWQPFVQMGGAEAQACDWVVLASNEAGAMKLLADRGDGWTVRPVRRFFGSISAGEFRICAADPLAEGLAAHNGNQLVGRFYLNDYRAKGINPARLALAHRVLDLLNGRR